MIAHFLKKALGKDKDGEERVYCSRFNGRSVSCLHGFRFVGPIAVTLKAGECTGTVGASGDPEIEAVEDKGLNEIEDL